MAGFSAFETAASSLKADPIRTRAALVALALAMAVLICLTSLVERGRAATIRSLERAGLKNLYLLARRRGDTVAAMPLTSGEADRIAQSFNARGRASVRLQNLAVTSRAASAPAAIYAVEGNAARAFALSARAGRLIGDLDVERKFPYCVVGSDLARRISPAAGVLGLVIGIGGRSYEVVGELEPSFSESASVGDIPSLDWDRAVVVPLGTEPGASLDPDSRYPVDAAVLEFGTAARAEEAGRLLPRIDPARYGPGGSVEAASPRQTLRHYRETRRTFDRIVWLVGILTTLSAVFGISNLLTASVAARAREIGVRRAVGARSRDIIVQFQMEGLLLGLAGGGAGLVLGLAVSLAAGARTEGGSHIVSLISISGLALTSAGIGVAAGIAPAIRASRIDPAAALREG